MSTYSFFRNLYKLPALLRARPTPVGIYGLPRGGTNFISAWLHYHPNVFCVSERCSDWRKPLYSYWKRRSLFRYDGIQGKESAQIKRIIFNKVQRFPELWDSGVEYPSDTKFIFYIRNPIRIHISRENFRKKHEEDRTFWADSRENFLELLSEAKIVFDTYRELSKRYQCLLLSHEYFCLHHSSALQELFSFLQVDDSHNVSPQSFFQKCGMCGTGYVDKKINGVDMLFCPKCGKPLEGYGNFNPLREINLDDVCSAKWKERSDIGDLMDDLRQVVGDDIAQYYSNGDYSKNIVCNLM
jgi:hypothetical protein